ncbi:hypothetical protein KIL84_010567 [Mauremys mutica]|uniref:Uncharacterized protein n=1 Tax=Mauremys mutica TaxID=74926 RepID=A0A9D4B1M1_9SAUR|nr:hypothetical protein KIL84_010567 [Mauremys mutica]
MAPQSCAAWAHCIALCPDGCSVGVPSPSAAIPYGPECVSPSSSNLSGGSQGIEGPTCTQSCYTDTCAPPTSASSLDGGVGTVWGREERRCGKKALLVTLGPVSASGLVGRGVLRRHT